MGTWSSPSPTPESAATWLRLHAPTTSLGLPQFIDPSGLGLGGPTSTYMPRVPPEGASVRGVLGAIAEVASGIIAPIFTVKVTSRAPAPGPTAETKTEAPMGALIGPITRGLSIAGRGALTTLRQALPAIASAATGAVAGGAAASSVAARAARVVLPAAGAAAAGYLTGAAGRCGQPSKSQLLAEQIASCVGGCVMPRARVLLPTGKIIRVAGRRRGGISARDLRAFRRVQKLVRRVGRK